MALSNARPRTTPHNNTPHLLCGDIHHGMRSHTQKSTLQEYTPHLFRIDVLAVEPQQLVVCDRARIGEVEDPCAALESHVNGDGEKRGQHRDGVGDVDHARVRRQPDVELFGGRERGKEVRIVSKQEETRSENLSGKQGVCDGARVGEVEDPRAAVERHVNGDGEERGQHRDGVGC